ncbi:MAG: T9SS type A sorting domain-containing protein, partial [Cytophagales bacterium]|nr:T9SS type A sorting domain-containing protein [Cytophagales bacterium]
TVPNSETYYVIVSQSALSSIRSRVGNNQVRGVDNDASGKVLVLSSGKSRTVEFSGLTPGLSYYVYAVAVKGSVKGSQSFSPNRYVPASTGPSAPSYAVSTTVGGLRFTQEGSVPEGETYYVIVSLSALSGIVSRIDNDEVRGVDNDSTGKFLSLSSGKSRTVEFSGLTPGLSYYVYAVAVNSGGATSQSFDPSRYTTNSLPPPSTSPLGVNGSSASVVYPNPSPGVVYISNAEPGQTIRIYSGSGIFLGTYILSSADGGVDLSALDAGLYILELNGTRYRVILE